MVSPFLPELTNLIVRLAGELQARRLLDWEYLQKWAEEFATLPGREHLVDTMKKLRRGHA